MNQLVAPMPGKVIKVLVSQGDNVEENQVAIILESMKMEIPVSIHDSGKIMEIKVKEGDSVPQEAVLLFYQ